MSLAIWPVESMALVLFAVHRLDSPTRPAILNSAPRFLKNNEKIFDNDDNGICFNDDDGSNRAGIRLERGRL